MKLLVGISEKLQQHRMMEKYREQGPTPSRGRSVVSQPSLSSEDEDDHMTEELP